VASTRYQWKQPKSCMHSEEPPESLREQQSKRPTAGEEKATPELTQRRKCRGRKHSPPPPRHIDISFELSPALNHGRYRNWFQKE
jgi:hypothetical protein